MQASSHAASLRFAGRLAWRVVSARSTSSAMRRSTARLRAAVRSRTRHRSSPKSTSSTQGSPFSTAQWRRMAAASASGGAVELLK